MNIRVIFTLVTMTCVLNGCGGLQERVSTLDQKQRESVTENTVTDVVQSTVTKPSPTVVEVPTRDGPARIEIPATSEVNTQVRAAAGVNSDSEASGKSLDKSAFPMWVWLLGTACGLAILLGVLYFAWAWLSRSLTFRGATGALDNFGGEVFRRISGEAAKSSDPATIATLMTLANDLEHSKQEWKK